MSTDDAWELRSAIIDWLRDGCEEMEAANERQFNNGLGIVRVILREPSPEAIEQTKEPATELLTILNNEIG